MPATLTITPVRNSRKLKIAGLCVLGLLIAAVVVLAFAWPFRREAVIQALADEISSTVTAGSFRQTYFPRPGCVLEQVKFQHNPKPGAPPLITMDRIRIEGSFTGLFARHVKLIRVEGMRVLIPPHGSEHFETPPRSSVVIDQLVADGAILQVASREAGRPALQFVFHGFTITDVGADGPAPFKAKLSNPEPPGEITTSGTFGPWNADEVGKTPVSGEYYFEHADLGGFHGVRGLLTSSGKYKGTLNRIAVDGTTDVPQFAVTSSSHQTQLQTRFMALVNAENGDVDLENVRANFRQTTLWTRGNVAGTQGQPGKTAALEIATRDGRIQDLLLLFITSPRAPMSGSVTFTGKVVVPPGQRPFLQKLELQGDFGIDAGTFTKSDTQQGVDSLSHAARGDKTGKKENDEADPENVLSDLTGHVVLKNGTATFSDLAFTVPGASARMNGTYNLIREIIDLHGTLTTNSEVSKTTHGIKAVMLKALDPFFKHKAAGYEAPVKITGTYDHPSFGLDLLDRQKGKPGAKDTTPWLKDRGKH